VEVLAAEGRNAGTCARTGCLPASSQPHTAAASSTKKTGVTRLRGIYQWYGGPSAPVNAFPKAGFDAQSTQRSKTKKAALLRAPPFSLA
jgi:hypothetical protein